MQLLPLVILFLGGVVLTIGDIVMKEWVVCSKTYLYIMGLAIYLVGLMFLAQSFKYKNIAVASMVIVIFNVVTLSIISWLVFKESLSFPQIIGLVLGVASVSLLELG